MINAIEYKSKNFIDARTQKTYIEFDDWHQFLVNLN